MSETNKVTVEFASTTTGVEAGSDAASAAVQQATAEIGTAVTQMAEKAQAAGQATSAAIEEAAEKSEGFLSGLTERVKVTGESFEHLHASLNVFGDAASAFGELVLAGLGIEKVADAVNEVAESGEQLLHLSEASGLTTEQLSALKLVTTEAGQNFDGFQNSVSRVANNMEGALRSSTSAGAEAFKALGVSVTDANGNLKPIGTVLDEVGNSLDKYQDGTNKSALEMSLFGMRGQELVPILQELQSDGGLQGATDKVAAMGGALSEVAAENDENFEKSIHDSTSALGILGSDLIQSIIPGLTSLMGSFNSSGAATVVLEIALNSLETALKGIIGTIALVEGGVDVMMDGFFAFGQEIGDTIRVLGAFKDAAEGNFREAETEVSNDVALMATNFHNAISNMDKDADNFDATINALKSTGGSVADVMSTLGDHQGGEEAPKPQAPVMDTGAADKAAKAAAKNELQIAQDAAQEQTQIAQLRYQQQVDIWDAEVAQGKITKAQELQDEISAANQQYAADMSAAQAKTALYAEGTAAKAKALDDETVLELKHNDAILKLDAQLAQEQAATTKAAQAAQKAYADGITKDFENAFKPIDSAFSSTINGIIQGTQTLQGGIDRMLGSMVLSVIDATEKMLMHWAAMELGKLVATANSQAGIEAINAQGKAVQAATDIAQIENAAAVAAAKAYAAVAGIPYIGPFLAPAAAAAAFVGVMAFDVISAAGGAENIASDGTLGILHAQEMVLPASIAAPLRANIASGGSGFSPGGGGGDVHMHFSPNLSVGAGASKADTTAALNEFAAAMYAWAQQNYGRNGALTLPGRTPA